MDYLLRQHNAKLSGEVLLSPSKSESNRALMIHALSGGKTTLKNLSDAQDTQTMSDILQFNPKVWDIIDAGTAMRFLTALLAIRGEKKIITGSPRMKERPIGPLVDALRILGSEIEYQEKEGYPPLKISKVAHQQEAKISVPGNISSQYISALLMIAPTLPKGLKIELTSGVFSKPYILMTLDLMNAFGVGHTWARNTISVKRGEYKGGEYVIESDWSGASYWYSFLALSIDDSSSVALPHLRACSSQGDRRVVDLMYDLGVSTEFLNDRVRLTKKDSGKKFLKLDLIDCPDLAQTLMVVAAVKGVETIFTGLESLKIKETDRIVAMQNELQKIGANLVEKEHKWHLTPTKQLPELVEIETYKDHRMAMAFAPLSQRMDIIIKGPGAVKKSYPAFWEEVKKAGIRISPH